VRGIGVMNERVDVRRCWYVSQGHIEGSRKSHVKGGTKREIETVYYEMNHLHSKAIDYFEIVENCVHSCPSEVL